MKIKFGRTRGPRRAGSALLALAAFAAAAPATLFAQTGTPDAADTDRAQAADSSPVLTPESVIQGWPEVPRDIARVMISKYGEPERFTADDLVWRDNGAWRQSVVYRSTRPDFIETRDTDYLQQTISYQVPEDKIADLRLFDKSIQVDRSKAEISSWSQSEPMNYLALNLAEEIITGKRTVDDARDFYSKMQELSQSGKSSPYLNGFVFTKEDDSRAAP